MAERRIQMFGCVHTCLVWNALTLMTDKVFGFLSQTVFNVNWGPFTEIKYFWWVLTFCFYMDWLGPRGVKLIFTEDHFNIMAAIKGPVVTVWLYKR